MSWGKQFPPRSQNEPLTEIIYEPGSQEEYSAANIRGMGLFRHRDNRLWSVVLTEERDHQIMARMRSDGTRAYFLIGDNIGPVKTSVLRFANLPVASYEDLVADAQGTMEHPIAGELCVFRLCILPRSRGVHWPKISQRSELTGLGRFLGYKLVVFPTAERIGEILQGCCVDDVWAIAPSEANIIPSEALIKRLDVDQTVQFIDSRVIDTERLNEVLYAYHEATSEQALEGLDKGTYCIKKERIIDLRDDGKSVTDG